MKYTGEMTISDPGKDKPIEIAGTLQCVHCGFVWVPRPGSGIVRGTCGKCCGPICGPKCLECVPQEKQLEIMEGTRKPDAVSVGYRGPIILGK